MQFTWSLTLFDPWHLLNLFWKDESSDDQTTVQIPTSWRSLFITTADNDSVLNLFFHLYEILPSGSCQRVLSCLGWLIYWNLEFQQLFFSSNGVSTSFVIFEWWEAAISCFISPWNLSYSKERRKFIEFGSLSRILSSSWATKGQLPIRRAYRAWRILRND